MSQQIDNVDARNFIVIKGAHIHNLKNLNVALPRNKLIVITGVSGSGKSSLAFDTLYAEGQRRYVESLSSYARQFLGRMSKPQVEYIRGIAPAIAIEQKVNTRNPRSTVGTNTEIYEYLKLLYARIGKTYSPVSGSLVQRDSVEDVVKYLLSKPEGTKAMIMAPMHIPTGRTATEHLNILQQQGFGRIRDNKTVKRIDAILQNNEKEKAAEEVMQIVVDRVVVKNDKETTARMADSVQTAFFEGRNTCEIATYEDGVEKITPFSKNFEKDGIHFEEPSINFFSFNNPYGACKTCEGFGSIIGIDRDLVIPDKSLSVYEDAIAPWRGEKMSEWKHALIRNAVHFNFPVHRPYYDLSEEEKELLWTGNRYFKGLNDFFRYLEKKAYKIQYRVMLSRYRGKTTCPACKGSRLREDAAYVKVASHAIHDLLIMPVDELTTHFNNLSLSKQEEAIASRLLTEIANRLQYLMDVGLGYLTLNRLSNTLSGGESQRINLATSLGSNLVGSMYILDEPSIGLHPRDTHRLLKVLKKLRDIGNTVLVVEHEEAIINEADEIIDIGPEAGSLGGELVFQGTKQQMVQESSSLTADYLAGRKTIAVPQQRRKWRDAIQITGARHNNLQNIDVKFPLNTITTVTGVSGSGKTSLVKGILYPALKKMSGGYGEKTGAFNKLSGEYDRISHIELVDQNPIGKSSRSNPATYVKAFDDIRTLFANQPLAKLRGYKPGYFSFNIPGGRCEECEGEGVVKIEMQFMADIYLTCESCKGTRFKSEMLEVKYRDHSVSDILNMTIDDAVAFLKASKNQDTNEKKVLQKLTPLADVGMGYVKLGQSANTLSGGEAQRIKLASFLSKGDKENPVLFIFDEPTTGLHFHDINKLLRSFNALVEKGHSVIVIEHNPEVIKSADWVIDLGPDGGKHGGRVMFEGTPEALAEADTHTSKFIREKLKDETDNF